MSLSKRLAKARGENPTDEFKADGDRERRKEPVWRQRAREGKLDPKVVLYDPDAPKRGYDS